ncbi:hypothetical protein HK096_004680 [Nowakowskiella sp. JEL0078]|nr:hypothetical protein HK096_004680 [Nowakowskiella sp. JEL0078]
MPDNFSEESDDVCPGKDSDLELSDLTGSDYQKEKEVSSDALKDEKKLPAKREKKVRINSKQPKKDLLNNKPLRKSSKVTPYGLFSRRVRNRIKKEHPDASTSQVTEIVKKNWADLVPEDQEEFIIAAKEHNRLIIEEESSSDSESGSAPSPSPKRKNQISKAKFRSVDTGNDKTNEETSETKIPKRITRLSKAKGRALSRKNKVYDNTVEIILPKRTTRIFKAKGRAFDSDNDNDDNDAGSNKKEHSLDSINQTDHSGVLKSISRLSKGKGRAFELDNDIVKSMQNHQISEGVNSNYLENDKDIVRQTIHTPPKRHIAEISFSSPSKKRNRISKGKGLHFDSSDEIDNDVEQIKQDLKVGKNVAVESLSNAHSANDWDGKNSGLIKMDFKEDAELRDYMYMDSEVEGILENSKEILPMVKTPDKVFDKASNKYDSGKRKKVASDIWDLFLD